RGDNDTNYLYMNPSDAQNLGFQEGALLDVQSKTSTVRVPMKLLPELSQGVVALPHGWGHQVAKGLSVANQTSGVNSNILAADGIENIERISGMAHLTGIPVEVKPAAAPLVKQSWSGLSEDVVTQ
ncbi:MAG: molybdopterin dinucleotide binding domain-containing protein, partial [Pseudomonadota bacterium]